jgi:hypothetical protein
LRMRLRRFLINDPMATDHPTGLPEAGANRLAKPVSAIPKLCHAGRTGGG